MKSIKTLGDVERPAKEAEAKRYEKPSCGSHGLTSAEVQDLGVPTEMRQNKDDGGRKASSLSIKGL